MATGEFEYVKPPHFYIDNPEEELNAASENLSVKKTPSLEPELETEMDNSKETAEIEIEIDDKTSTTKIVVKESTKPVRGRTPKLSGKESELAAKYRKGATLKELGAEYGVSVPCISNALKRAGETVRSRGRQKGKTL
tara:strand:+ start:244 stop:657 length:414 start_codon:yes stop_codon:yes gene_type:complete